MSRAKAHAEAIVDTLARSRPPAQAPSISPSKAATLHMYRHILREVSYLPPAIRQNIHDPVCKRFRQNKGDVSREKQHTRRANSALRGLRAANSGDKRAMQGLILKSFGRSWIRRHTLVEENFTREDMRPISKFKSTAAPQDSTDLEAMIDGHSAFGLDTTMQNSNGSEGTKGGGEISSSGSIIKTPAQAVVDTASEQKKKPRPFERWDHEKTTIMLKSQKQAQGSNATTDWPAGPIKKHMSPDSALPDKNIWGKDPAEEVLQTKRAAWWKLQMVKIMPPVPKEEWELLGKLARGFQEEGALKVPRRRTRAQQLSDGEAESSAEWDWERYAEEPIARVERSKYRLNQLRSGEAPMGPFGHKIQPQKQPDRWFRRVYEQTWALTPCEEQSPRTQKTIFRWGGIKAKRDKPTKLQMSVFEGVDDRGRPLKQPGR